MNQKVGITVAATADTSQVVQAVNALGQKIAQANRVQFTPVSQKSIDDVKKLNAALNEVLRTQTGLRQRLKATGQESTPFTSWDWQRMYPHAASRGVAMQSTFDRVVGPGQFNASPQQPGGGRQGGGWSGAAAGVAQAGLRGAGPVGGVAAGALGTGMSAGFGAGLMGLVGGIAALGVGKLVGAIAEKVGQAEQNNVDYDRLKRMIGDVGVSFGALKTVVQGSADQMRITYAEAGKLGTQFVRLSNLTGEQYKTLGGEIETGVGLSRSFGLDPSIGVGALGQMRGMGITTNTQESRRFALLLGETIGKSGAFAKAEEVFEAIGGYATSQTRNSMGAANVAGYAGMYSSMVGSGIPGMDPAGAAGLLSRINATLASGGAKGEASQFFTGIVGHRMGLDPIQTQILREGGAFATNDEAFGPGSAAARFGMAGPGGSKTFLQGSMDELRSQYGGNKGQLAQATANHLGIGMRQAMALLSLNPNEMGEMQAYAGDLTKMSGKGIGNLSKALYGKPGEREALRSEFLGRTGADAISAEDRRSLQGASTDEELKKALASMAAKYDQERTTGSDIRDSKNALDNIKVSLADKMVPLMTDIRLGIMHIAGGGKRSPKQIMEEVMRLEAGDRVAGIKGSFAGSMRDAASAPGSIRAEREAVLDDLRKNYNTMSDGERATKQKRVQELTDQLFAAEEKARKDVIRLKEEEAKALKDANAELEKSVQEMRAQGVSIKTSSGAVVSTAGAGRGHVNPDAVGGSGGGGKGYDPLSTSGGGARVTSGFGMRVHPISGRMKHHNGIDFGAKAGTPISATADGEVVRSEMSRGGYGNVIEVQHADGSVTRYAHNKSNGVKVGQKVKAGDVIGEVGSTGNSTGNHLHYELLKDGKATDPNAAFKSGEHRRPIGSTPAGELGSSGAGAGRGFDYNVTADDITVRIVDDKTGKPVGPTQTIKTRVGAANAFGGSGGSGGVTGQW